MSDSAPSKRRHAGSVHQPAWVAPALEPGGAARIASDIVGLPTFNEGCPPPTNEDLQIPGKQAYEIDSGAQRQRNCAIVSGASVCLCGIGNACCDNAVRPASALIGAGLPRSAERNRSIVGALVFQHRLPNPAAEVLAKDKASTQHRSAKHRNTVRRLFATSEEHHQQRVARKAFRMYFPK
jgi:hypothetical protein